MLDVSGDRRIQAGPAAPPPVFARGLDLVELWFWLMPCVWTIFIGLAFWWYSSNIHRTVVELARVAAAASFEKDVLYRDWAAMHGGVYVPATPGTPPNPYLKNVPERDISSPSGRHLTLMNPAYMTRQVHELGREFYHHHDHITSLNPIRPENKPDVWERKALESFNLGAKEFYSVETIEGERYLRLMRPLVTTEYCLKCHAAQGYKAGDIRGGICVTVLMRDYEVSVGANHRLEMLAHGGLWLVGLVMLFWGRRHYRRQRHERDLARAALEAGEARFRSIFEDSPIAICDLDFSEARFRLGQLTAQGVTDLRDYLARNPAELMHLAGLVRVLEINQASVRVFGATSKAEVSRDLPVYFTDETLPVFAKDLITLAAGQTRFTSEVPILNAVGKPVVYDLSLSVQPGHEATLSSVLLSFVDITDRKRVERALTYNESLLRQSQSVARIGHYVFSAASGNWTSSPVLEEIFGIGPEYPKSIKGWLGLVHPDDRAEMAEYIGGHVMRDGNPFDREYRVVRPSDGAVRWMHGLGKLLRAPDGSVVEMFGTIQDITERRLAEEEREKLQVQLVQAQKMESIGRLAGGVAHDFNNLLTVINGYSDLVLAQLPPQSPIRQQVEEIKRAGVGAADLTQQLLTFSRKQVIQPRLLNLNDLVAGSERMLQRLLGEDIDLVTELSPALWPVLADAGQINQVLMNLAANARDAMPAGGRLTIATANVSDGEAGREEGQDGPSVLLRVTDTGVGMDEATQRHVFEPFFTTKGIGKGTGLGLSTICGVVAQNKGQIYVDSEPGKGATFRIYLPRANQESAETEHLPAFLPRSRGSETILLVEDEAAVRRLIEGMLQSQGYRVFGAGDGAEALAMLERIQEPLHLLLTDVILPGIDGRQLAERVRALRPDIEVLYMSGYTDDVIAQRGILEPGLVYLGKPFTPSGLVAKVREVLDAAGPAGIE